MLFLLLDEGLSQCAQLGSTEDQNDLAAYAREIIETEMDGAVITATASVDGADVSTARSPSVANVGVNGPAAGREVIVLAAGEGDEYKIVGVAMIPVRRYVPEQTPVLATSLARQLIASGACRPSSAA